VKLITVTLPENPTSAKLYPVLRRLLPQIPDFSLREAFRRRDVKLDGVRAGRDALAEAGAEIKIYLSDERILRSPEIVYEDDRLMIVDKPAGVSCEPDAKGGPTVGEWLYRANAERLSSAPVPCHRLDNPTDGLLILAKDEETRKAMEQAFLERRVQKTYICLVRGVPQPPRAELRAWIVKDAAAARVRVLDRPAPGALTAVTEYRVLQAGPVSRLEVKLHTGRTHQIRAQMAHIGHPVLGDDKYGDREFNRAHHAARLMLTAAQLSFRMEGTLSYLNDKRFTLPPKF